MSEQQQSVGELQAKVDELTKVVSALTEFVGTIANHVSGSFSVGSDPRFWGHEVMELQARLR